MWFQAGLLMYQVRYNNQGGAAFLGQFFKNEELQRCIEHIPNMRMVMEASVCTTAPYCDRIRVLCLYTLEAVSKKSSFLKINFHIAYVKNVNGMTKVFMERGARGRMLDPWTHTKLYLLYSIWFPILLLSSGGLQKNFEIYVQTLEKFVPLLNDVEQEDEAVASLPPPACSSGDEFIRYGLFIRVFLSLQGHPLCSLANIILNQA